MKYPFVSIIIPTLNEERNLPRVLESIKKIDYPPEKIELLIVDGGSTDKTIEIAKRFGAKIFKNPLKIRGAGCKIGVEKAKGNFIAFTDADCVVPANWLKDLLSPLTDPKVASVGGPNVTPKDDSQFAKAVGEVINLLTKPGSRYGLFTNKIAETYHNPGCNVLYKKEPILKVGNFNPKLLTCEDEELDFRLRQKGYKLLFTPKVVVDHYRRPTYKKIFVQFYRFAIGRAQAGKLHPKMLKWFHFVPSLGLLGIFGGVGCILSAFKVWGGYFLTTSFLVLLTASFYLSLSKKTAPFYVYLRIILNWFFGWSFGFLVGFAN